MKLPLHSEVGRESGRPGTGLDGDRAARDVRAARYRSHFGNLLAIFPHRAAASNPFCELSILGKPHGAAAPPTFRPTGIAGAIRASGSTGWVRSIYAIRDGNASRCAPRPAAYNTHVDP